MHHEERAKFYVTIGVYVVMAILMLCAVVAARGDEVPPHAGDFGLPHGVQFDNGAFLYSPDAAAKNPRWVAHVLTDDDAGPLPARSDDDRFYADLEIPKAWRSTNADYLHAQTMGRHLDRGHAYPFGDAITRAAQHASMALSNARPQDSDNNQNFWGKRVETACRALRGPGLLVYVLDGQLYPAAGDDGMVHISTIGPNHVWVPDRIWKTALVVRKADKQPVGGRAWLVPNAPIAHDVREEAYRVSIDTIEDLYGDDFYPLVDDAVEAVLESKT